jgi:hypothetical protein
MCSILLLNTVILLFLFSLLFQSVKVNFTQFVGAGRIFPLKCQETDYRIQNYWFLDFVHRPGF